MDVLVWNTGNSSYENTALDEVPQGLIKIVSRQWLWFEM